MAPAHYHINGEIYFGAWVNDKAEGYGEYIHTNKDTYKGNWKNDSQNGKGVEQGLDMKEITLMEINKGRKHKIGLMDPAILGCGLIM